jgi:hypothetical protein
MIIVVAIVMIGSALADRSPNAHTSKTCSDYSNQKEAQQHHDTIDADHDGIYCESLPCPCLKPGSGGGGGGTPQPGTGGGTSCGVERWSVKTLSDGATSRVNFRPKDTTVQTLRGLRSPGVGYSTPRIRGVETTTYRLRAQLVEMKQEDDRDIHLVIAAPNRRSATMIVEFPDVKCSGARNSAKRSLMQKARPALTRACGSPGRLLVHATRRQSDDHGRRFLRHQARATRHGAERDRVASGDETPSECAANDRGAGPELEEVTQYGRSHQPQVLSTRPVPGPPSLPALQSSP